MIQSPQTIRMVRDGVVGAQRDVWPSGMSRDQPADPATVVTLAEQRAEIDRLREEGPSGSRLG